MKIPFASALLALALPAFAQEPAANTAPENLFYKAFWLERGSDTRDPAQAMVLYEKFLAAAPDHELAPKAATFQFELLTRTGKVAEAQAFAKKYEKLLGNVAVGNPERGAGERGAGERGGRGEGARGAGGRRGNPEERLAELRKELEEAKASGDDERVAQLEQQIARIERMARGGAGGAGGAGGERGGRGGFRNNPLFGNAKLADLSAEELEQFKTGLDDMGPMMDRFRERMTDEQRKAFDENMAALKKALAANDLDAGQKAVDKLRENMPRRGRGRGGN